MIERRKYVVNARMDVVVGYAVVDGALLLGDRRKARATASSVGVCGRLPVLVVGVRRPSSECLFVVQRSDLRMRQPLRRR